MFFRRLTIAAVFCAKTVNAISNADFCWRYLAPDEPPSGGAAPVSDHALEAFRRTALENLRRKIPDLEDVRIQPDRGGKIIVEVKKKGGGWEKLSSTYMELKPAPGSLSIDVKVQGKYRGMGLNNWMLAHALRMYPATTRVSDTLVDTNETIFVLSFATGETDPVKLRRLHRKYLDDADYSWEIDDKFRKRAARFDKGNANDRERLIAAIRATPYARTNRHFGMERITRVTIDDGSGLTIHVSLERGTGVADDADFRMRVSE